MKLLLHYCFFHDTDLIHILQPLTTLEHLDLRGEGDALTSNVFMRLTPVPILTSDTPYTCGTAMLCPKLSSLNIRVGNDELSRADERVEATFSLVEGLIGRGGSSVRIYSDAWAIVHKISM